MKSKVLEKYWYKIHFPDGISLVEAVGLIEKYIQMEANNEI